jgi:hypothetical protein
MRESFIDFIQTILAQAVAVMFFQIGFCGVGEFHLDAPAINGMYAFKRFSATGTGFGHLLIFLKVRADVPSARTELGIGNPRRISII